MHLDLRRYFHETDQLNQLTRPTDFFQSINFFKSIIDTPHAQPY